MQLEKITSVAERSKFISLTTTTFALIYHIIIIGVFFYLKVYPMVIFNIFSILCFSALIYTVTIVKTFVIPYIIAFTEVVVHQILASLFLGSEASFHYFILLVGLLPFLVFGNRFKISITATIVSSIIFIVIENLKLKPMYEISDGFLKLIKFMNVFLSITVIIFSNFIYTYIVYKIQKKLEIHGKNLENEIKMAANIQQSFFKQTLEDFNGVSGYTAAYFSSPMAEVSGDTYDFYSTENKLDGLSLFDVSGHGISSGLVTMLVKNIIQQEFYNHPDYEIWEVLNDINDRIIEEKGNIQNYLTGILIRTLENKIEIGIAGHPLPVLYKKSTGKCQFYEPAKRSIGAVGIASFPVYYSSEVIDFEDGDELFLYSDGICDAENDSGENFGSERLLETVQSVVNEDINEQIQKISGTIKDFRGAKDQNDDITFIILKGMSNK